MRRSPRPPLRRAFSFRSKTDKLKEPRAEYVKALEDKAAGGNIVGLAFAVNGRINSADLYPSNGLFAGKCG